MNFLHRFAKSLAPAVGIACGLLLSGCIPEKGDKTIITYSMWGSTEQLRVEQQVVDLFEKENPEIGVHIIAFGRDYSEKLQAMMVGKNAPDVIMVGLQDYADWAKRNVLEDITGVVEQMPEWDDLMPVPKNALSLEGRVYGIPVNCHGHVSFYNKTAFRAIGEDPQKGFDWYDIFRWGEILAEKAKDDPTLPQYISQSPGSLFMVANQGVQLFDNKFKPTRVTVDNEKTRECFHLLRLIGKSPHIVKAQTFDNTVLVEGFRDGKVALHFDGRWRTPELLGVKDFKWDVAPAPNGPDGPLTSHGGTTISIYKESRNKSAATRLLKFFTRREAIQIGIDGGRYTPVFRKYAMSDDYLKKGPPESMHRFVETMETGASTWIFYGPGQKELMTIIDRSGELALHTDVEIDLIVEQLEADLNRWMLNNPLVR